MTTCEELGREWQRIDQIIAVKTHEATYDRLQNEPDAVERLIRETKAQSMPDASAKLSLAAWRLGGTIPDEMRDLLSEIANNFGKGAPSLGDLVTRGLWNMVDDAAIAEIAARSAPLEACQQLVDAALAAGGYDNVSVGICALRALAGRATVPQGATRPIEIAGFQTPEAAALRIIGVVEGQS